MERYDWYHLDEYRESWLLLVLPLDYSPAPSTEGENMAAFWELAVANLDEIVYTKTVSALDRDVSTADEFYRQLLEALHDFRYRNLLLITPDAETIQRLRRGLLTSTLETASLRGFTHLSLSDELGAAFGTETTHELLGSLTLPSPIYLKESEMTSSNGATRELWEFWSRILRLLPAETSLGAEL